jgi:hypothetical protein
LFFCSAYSERTTMAASANVRGTFNFFMVF